MMCVQSEFLFANQGRGQGPRRTLALRASQRFVHGGLTERVIIVVVVVSSRCWT